MNDLVFNNFSLALNDIISLNKFTENYGLSLTKEQAITLVKNRNTVLKDIGRIEMGGGILEKLIYEFYDSTYIDKYSYLETLIKLTDIFYLYQGEFDYKLTDEQIIKYMRSKFEKYCGSLELLEGICFEELKENGFNESCLY